MPGLMKNVPVTDAQRRDNDRHRPAVVLAVLAVLCVYIYLFTHIADTLGLPLPEDVADEIGLSIDHVFDSDRNVDSMLRITQTQRFKKNDDERLVYFLVLALAFVSVYFLPLRHKQPALAFWTCVAIFLLYGSQATTALLAMHLVVFIVLHPKGDDRPWLAGFVGLFLWWTVFPELDSGALGAALFVVLPAATTAAYRWLIVPALAVPRLAPVLRTTTIQSAILTVCIGAFYEGLVGDEWKLPLGILLFFWQWERLMMYHVDFKDGLIPEDITFWKYLAVFLHPGAVSNWTWGVTIGQGYDYANNAFLCEDKNKIVLSGVKIWGVALLYLIFWNWLRNHAVDFFTDLGVPVFRARTRSMVQHFVEGGSVSTPTVLMTTLLDLIRWMMIWAAVVHFKVGVWRVCGYRMDPYINKPWLATNMATLWSRFTFHYREFLVRCFYYPVFFRVFKTRPYLRVFVATMAAACVGNLVWGHVTERLYYRGLEFEHFLYPFGTWPYYVLLGIGISVAQINIIRKRRRRKPWTLDRWFVTDLIAMYCTIQFFALIHIFSRPSPDGTVWDLFRLFLKGFGISIAS